MVAEVQNYLEPKFPSGVYIEASNTSLTHSLVFYPSLLKVIGDRVFGKDTIDIGCGDGKLAQELIKLGANKIIGIDSNHEMINYCKTNYNYTKNVDYREESSFDLSDIAEYDFAFAIFVLQFHKNAEDLRKSLINIARSLKPGGEFVAFVPNGVGDYFSTKSLGIQFGACIILNAVPPIDGEQLKVEFFNPEGDVIGNTDITFFYRSTYEHCLKDAGFVNIEWIDPTISEEGLKKYGANFFSSFFNPPKDIIFRAQIPP